MQRSKCVSRNKLGVLCVAKMSSSSLRGGRITKPCSLDSLTQNIHSIVAISAPLERMFGPGGNIVTQKRPSLLLSNAESFIFLQTNLYEDGEEYILLQRFIWQSDS